MRTTLNIDDELLRGAQARFPKGTPKTVVIEEALRLLIERPDSAPAQAAPPHHTDPRWARLVRQGIVAPATRTDPLPSVAGPGLPLARLLEDLAADRAER